MRLESNGILISMRPFDETSAIAHVFSREYGILSGMLRGAIATKSNKPLVGQTGFVSWNARVDSALGVLHWESEKNLALPLMQHMELLSFMNAAFSLIDTMLPEREQYTKLYDETVSLLVSLVGSNNAPETYLKWETTLLRELGYALDLSRCSGCGKTDDLNYLSSKTGRAVCSTCATPYMSQVYKLPLTLDTTLCFIAKICNDMGAVVPHFRKMLANKKF